MSLSKKNQPSPPPGSFDELLNKPAPKKKSIFKFALKEKAATTPTKEGKEGEEKENEDEEATEDKKDLKWQSPFRFGSIQKKKNTKVAEAPLDTPKIFGKLRSKHEKDIKQLDAKNNELNSAVNKSKAELDAEYQATEEAMEKEKQRLQELEELRVATEKEAKGPIVEETPSEAKQVVEDEENDIPDESDELNQEAKLEKKLTEEKEAQQANSEAIEPKAISGDEQIKEDDELLSVQNNEKETEQTEGPTEPAPSKVDSGVTPTPAAAESANAEVVDHDDVVKDLKAVDKKTEEAAAGTKKSADKQSKFGFKKFFGFGPSDPATEEEKAKQVTEKHQSKLQKLKTKSEATLKGIETKYESEISKIKSEISKVEKRITHDEETKFSEIEDAQKDHEAKTKELEEKHEEEKKKFHEETLKRIEIKKVEIANSVETQGTLAKELEELESKYSEQLLVNKATEDKLDQLLSKLNAQRETASTLKAEREFKLSEISKLTEEKEEIIGKIKQNEEDVTKHNKTIEAYNNKDHMKEIEAIEAEIVQLEKQVKAKELEETKVKDSDIETRAHITFVEQQLEINEDKTRILEQKKEKTYTKNDENELTLQDLKFELQDLKEEDVYNEKEQELEKKIKEAKKERSELTEQYHDIADAEEASTTKESGKAKAEEKAVSSA